MRGTAKGEPPGSFEQWKTDNADLNPKWNALSGHQAASDLNTALWKEQMGLCVYCGRTIVLGKRNAQTGQNTHHVEHYKPRNGGFKDLTFDFGNLLLSCGQSYEGDTPEGVICGAAKGNVFDEDRFGSPLVQSCRQRFSFTENGEAEAVDDGGRWVIQLLNLNDPQLIVQRRRVWTQFLEEAQQEGLPPDIDAIKSSDLLKFYEEADASGTLPAFAHVVSSIVRSEDQHQAR